MEVPETPISDEQGDFSDEQNCLEKEETHLRESKILIMGKILSKAQQPTVKDDSLSGGKAGLSECLLKQGFSGWRPKVARVACSHFILNA